MATKHTCAQNQFLSFQPTTTIGKNKKLSKDIRNKTIDMQEAGMDY